MEDLIASCDGKSKPIRSYSSIELMRATNNFDPSCIIQHFPGELGYNMYRGVLDDRSIIVLREQEMKLGPCRIVTLSFQCR